MASEDNQTLARERVLGVLARLPTQGFNMTECVNWMAEILERKHTEVLSRLQRHPDVRDAIRMKAPNEFDLVLASTMYELTGMRWKPIGAEAQVDAILRPQRSAVPDRVYACMYTNKGCPYTSGRTGIKTHQRSCEFASELPPAPAAAPAASPPFAGPLQELGSA